MSRPRVLVTTDRRPPRPELGRREPRLRPPRAEFFVAEAVVEHLRRAGAAVLLVPPGDPSAAELLDVADALVVTGGAFDIHPQHYGQAVQGRLDPVDEGRTGMELALCRAALERGMPLLGICGGMQAMAVAAGGTLLQDIRAQVQGALEHEQPTDPATSWHPLEVEAAWQSLLPEAVNSTHHQAVDHPGPFSVIARASDGVIEAIALPGHPFAAGVQWHPEWLDGRVFGALVEKSRR